MRALRCLRTGFYRILHGYWLDLGFIPYTPAFAIQERILHARLEGKLPVTVIVQENPPTFTIGRDGSSANILISPDELRRRGIEILEVNRGGDVTYHGPGQLIVSPLLYLGDIGLSANAYLHSLEDVIINVLIDYGIQTSKKPGSPGVWVGEAKIAAVGIAVKQGYTFHGFSINVDMDLTPYTWINPCGVSNMTVTSMARVLGRHVSLSEVKTRVRSALMRIFHLELQDITWNELQSMLD